MKKVMKYVPLYIVCSLLGLIIGNGISISNQPEQLEKNYVNAIVSYGGIDSVLEDADIVVEATVKNITAENQYEVYDVVISQVLKGNYNEKALSIRNYYMNYSYEYANTAFEGTTNCNYEVGQSYIFVLQHINSIYDERYVILSDTYLPTSNTSACTLLSTPINVEGNALQYVKDYSYSSNKGTGQALSIPYTESTDLSEIILASSYIAEIEIGELNSTSDTTDLYKCKVNNIYKGNLYSANADEIYIVFFKDTVSPGEQYIVLLNSDTDTSLLYTLSSRNSIHTLNNAETIRNMLQGE